MTPNHDYVKHQVARQDRSDGSILLRSELPLGPVAKNTGQWLQQWAADAPQRTFLMERSGPGWRQITYQETLEQVEAVAASLLARGMDKDTPIVVLSGAGIDHGVLQLATQYVGIPIAPLAEQYSLMPQARPRLAHCIQKIKPAMVFAENAERYRDTLRMDMFNNTHKFASYNASGDVTAFAELLKGKPDETLQSVRADVGPDTLAKILFTSGSTGNPKGVPQSQRMLTINQAQYLAALPMLSTRPPVIVDWLPWNHVFAGNSTFNMTLANGGTLILDDGKPVKGLFDRTLENLAMHVGTMSLNVPVAYGMLVNALGKDKTLRNRFFADLDLIFYAGASLPVALWSALEDMSREVTGRVPMMTSSWGLTETAPGGLIHHQGGAQTGMIGVPVPQLDVKLVPYQQQRYEIRVKGPSVITAYFDEPAKDAESFDDEGYFITNDAVRFVDEHNMTAGLRFDGRITEDFKLLTGTWVQAAKIRLQALAALEGLVQDVVVTGADRDELGLLIFAAPAKVSADTTDKIVNDPAYREQIKGALVPLASTSLSSSNRIARFLIMAQPPSVKDGEITAKGSLNINAVMSCRSDLLDQLYADNSVAAVKL